MQKKWNVIETDKKKCKEFAEELGISKVTAALLLHRGITEPSAADVFLQPEKQEFYDPFLFRDMDKAVKRIQQAIAAKEKIVLYGDYDVDGITSVVVLKHSLQRLGAEVEYYIPDRQKEGYGFHTEALLRLAEAGTGLLISVDCGISAVSEVEAVKDRLDIIITDHHLPGEILPAVLAVIDAHRLDCKYPDKNLSGVGVAFKLSQALWKIMRNQEILDDIEIVALGTVADIVPLLGENRRIVQLGLKKMQETDCLGLQALLRVADLKGKELNSQHIGFCLAPRLNAAGRMDSAAQGVELLLTTDARTAEDIAMKLNAENIERQTMEKTILAEAEKQLLTMDWSKTHSIVLAGEGWHPGVIGIVASRIVDKYYRPTIIISEKDGICKGSCRSIRGFHMYKALTACAEYLLGFGGHEQAAGLSLEKKNLAAFCSAFDSYAEHNLSEEDYVPVVDIEFELPPTQVDFSLLDELSALEPYGMGNPKPLFGCRNIRGSYATAIGKEGQHLRFQVEATDHSVTALAWNKSEYVGIVNREKIDLVYVPQINEYRGRKSIQCMVEDFSSSQEEKVFPEHDVLGRIYLFLRNIQHSRQTIPYTAQQLVEQYVQQGQSISFYTMQKALAIFEELDLLRQDQEQQQYFMPPAPNKKLDLMESSIYRKGMRCFAE